jgi:ribosomal protein S18 acetylase RimI-like enzyme
MRRITFAEIETAEATAVLNRVYEGYVVPMVLSEAQTDLHLGANDIDLTSSPLWYEGDDAVAAALLGVRGARGWIGGFGLAPPYRGRGLAAELLAETLSRARARGVREIQLEVLVQNGPAIRTYERGEFRATGRLNSYRADAPADATAVQNAATPCDDVDELIRKPAADATCWQCESPSLEQQAARLHGVREGDGYALFRHNGSVAQVLKIAVGDAASLERLTNGIFASTGVKTVVLFNQLAGGSVDYAARDAGWQPAFTQHEMRRELNERKMT